MTNTDRVLTAIKEYWRENFIPPTIRAVQQVTGINSTSLIRGYYIQLESQGAIQRIKSKPVPTEIIEMLRKESSHADATQ